MSDRRSSSLRGQVKHPDGSSPGGGKQNGAKKPLNSEAGKELRERKPRDFTVFIQESGNLVLSHFFLYSY